jgi:hypothetical protein
MPTIQTRSLLARSVAAAMLLAACATPAASSGPEALRGCWIERREGVTVTQRWFPKGDGWQGDELSYVAAGAPEPGRWRLRAGPDPAVAPWLMCMVELSMASGPPCWRAFFGPGRADGDDDRWVEIDATPERLRIRWLTAGEGWTSFDGQRDGCD